ncbi:hypothetical protein FOA52_001065 [Chlamydomonas sp. UWO 241]|nr:hypothetical protein FOA52_001065 [Chlamydomonas sp. UWO 241]
MEPCRARLGNVDDAGPLREPAAVTLAVVPEAVVDVDAATDYTEVTMTEETEDNQPAVAAHQAGGFLGGTSPGRILSGAAIGLLALSVVVTAKRLWDKSSTVQAKRLRQIQKNKLLVTELSKFLPDKRFKLKPGVIGRLRKTTGFNEGEVFRKFMWYLLRVRKFDADAVADLVALEAAAELSDLQVADAIAERAQRVNDKYGPLMLNAQEAGFSASSLERKATCKALFQKLLYLSECEQLVAQGSEAAGRINLRVIFGASELDVSHLRIVSLFDVDLEAAWTRPQEVTDDEADEEPPHLKDNPPRRSA